MNDIRNQTSALLADLRAALPVAAKPLPLAGRRCGLVVIDEQNGFATVGAGPLAPSEPNAQIARMVAETDQVARLFEKRDLPIAVSGNDRATDLTWLPAGP